MQATRLIENRLRKRKKATQQSTILGVVEEAKQSLSVNYVSVERKKSQYSVFTLEEGSLVLTEG